MKTTFIYVLKDPRTEEIRYVGKADDPKIAFRRHIYNAKSGKQFYTSRWIRQLLLSSSNPEIEIVDEISNEYWPQLEVAYIDFYKESGCDLTNSTFGGDSGPTMPGSSHPMFGKKHKPESIKKMSVSRIGKKHTLEAKANMRAAKAKVPHPMLGKKHRPEAIKKMSVSHIGKKQPATARQKIRVGLFGVKKKSNTSGYCGVSKLGKKWRAYFKVAAKQIHVGVFNTKEEAASALAVRAI